MRPELAWRYAVEQDKLAWALAHRAWRIFQPRWTEPQDLHSVAMIAIEHAAERYQEGVGALSSYAYAMAWGEVKKHIFRNEPQEVLMDEDVRQSLARLPEESPVRENEAGVRRIAAALPKMQRLFLVGRYVYGYTPGELGHMVGGMTPQRVAWQIAEGLRSLRGQAAD